MSYVTLLDRRSDSTNDCATAPAIRFAPPRSRGDAHHFRTDAGRLNRGLSPFVGRAIAFEIVARVQKDFCTRSRGGVLHDCPASFDKLRMRKACNGTKIGPHPELVEGRRALITSSATSAAPRLRVQNTSVPRHGYQMRLPCGFVAARRLPSPM